MRLFAAVLALFLVTAVPAHADPRIVGGTPVGSISEYPWMVALTTAGGYQYCGGALVAPRLVATAAHCVSSKQPGSIYVVGGRLNLTTSEGITSKVTQFQVAGGYTIPQQGRDIALLTLAVEFPYPVLPIADATAYAPGAMGTVLGWGRNAEGDTNKSPVLHQASVPIMADTACGAAYASFKADSMFSARATCRAASTRAPTTPAARSSSTAGSPASSRGARAARAQASRASTPASRRT